MSKQEDDFLYDEDDAVKYIRNYLPQELKSKFKNDDILYILDLIYDYYESNGLLSEDASDDQLVEIDEDELIDEMLDRFGDVPQEVINLVKIGTVIIANPLEKTVDSV